jgi:pyruvate/2-oxoglutarate dehydrogenase complex dihydrolipoamide dehydrogenase (E3) component
MIRVATIDSAGTESMQDVPFDAIFSGIGRVLNIDNLSLEKAGIQTNTEKTRLIVDDYLRTTNHRVYAVGDVAGRHMFTHAAEMHARVVISNILSPFKKKVSGSMAWVTYTNPEVGTFGSSAEVLTRTRVAFSETTAPVTSEDRGIVDDAQGFLTLYTGAKNVILGGTLVAPHAGEMIGELILATEHKMTTGDLFARVAPYPTLARIIRRVSSKQESKKLTPLAKRILRVLCRLL